MSKPKSKRVIEPNCVVLVIRGHDVYGRPPPGTIPVAGPFRPGTEDWMLFRAMQDMVAGGIGFVLVQETARKELGGYTGVSVWRSGVQAI
jgi:hypothetical protein